jgi:aspartate-semialdehyde dehydrogenase
LLRKKANQCDGIEMEFLKAEFAVFSNAKNYRRDPLVPLVVPTVNLPHFDVIPHQRKHYNLKKGLLVCNSNCAVIGIVIPFAAIQKEFGEVDQVSVVTMQAVSGAGYPGVSSMDILDNVVPFISGEEDKLETEAQKILGKVNAEMTGFSDQSDLKVSAACNRVPVLDGHMACVSLRFKNRSGPKPTAEAVKKALSGYVSEAQALGCPSAPEPTIMVMDQPDRPQPRLDRNTQRGYTVSVGRVREDDSGIFDLKFVALSHNSKSLCSLVDSRLMCHSCHRSCWIFNIEFGGCSTQGLHLDFELAWWAFRPAFLIIQCGVPTNSPRTEGPTSKNDSYVHLILSRLTVLSLGVDRNCAQSTNLKRQELRQGK